MDHRRSQKGRAVKCPHYCWDRRVKKHRCRAVSLMFRPIKAPSDFSRHNGYFHSEHLASLITQWTSTEQGNHFKGIVTRWSSPITSQEKIPVGWEVGLFFKQFLQIREFISGFFFRMLFCRCPLTQVRPCHHKKPRAEATGDVLEHHVIHKTLQPLKTAGTTLDLFMESSTGLDWKGLLKIV